VWATLKFCPSKVDSAIAHIVASSLAGYDIYPDDAAAAAGYDSAPGGVWEVPIFEEVAAGIRTRVTPWLKAGNCCFIPTNSALGIPGTDYFRCLTEEVLKEESIFDAVAYHKPNSGEQAILKHVTLTPQLIGFLKEHAFGIK
jgi:hypothetical protein